MNGEYKTKEEYKQILLRGLNESPEKIINEIQEEEGLVIYGNDEFQFMIDIDNKGRNTYYIENQLQYGRYVIDRKIESIMFYIRHHFNISKSDYYLIKAFLYKIKNKEL